jgi:hypothetical protein
MHSFLFLLALLPFRQNVSHPCTLKFQLMTLDRVTRTQMYGHFCSTYSYKRRSLCSFLRVFTSICRKTEIFFSHERYVSFALISR